MIVSEEEAFAIIAAYAPNVQILEVVCDFYTDPISLEYHQMHEVPGFFQISIDRFEEGPTWNFKSDETMIKVLEEYAIRPGTEMRILIYDNIQINCGQATSRFDASARLYSVLNYFGVKNVSIIMDNAMNEHFEDEYAANHPEIVNSLAAAVHTTSKESPALDPDSVSPASSSAQKSGLRARIALLKKKITTARAERREILKKKLQTLITAEKFLLSSIFVPWSEELMTKSAPLFQKRTQIKTGQHKALTENLYTTIRGENSLLHPPSISWPQDMLSRAPLGKEQFVSYQTMVKLVAGELGLYRLLDARSAEEHAGQITGYDYVFAAGRIPTSESVVNADYQLSVDDSLADVLKRLETTLQGKGISKSDRLIWYCGTGWRATRMCTLTQLLGYKNVAIYEGGWNEWYQRHQG